MTTVAELIDRLEAMTDDAKLAGRPPWPPSAWSGEWAVTEPIPVGTIDRLLAAWRTAVEREIDRARTAFVAGRATGRSGGWWRPDQTDDERQALAQAAIDARTEDR